MTSESGAGFLADLQQSRAALELYTAQSTVSYAVAELEKELGVKLLERGRAEPTEVGLKLPHTRGIFQLADAVQRG